MLWIFKTSRSSTRFKCSRVFKSSLNDLQQHIISCSSCVFIRIFIKVIFFKFIRILISDFIQLYVMFFTISLYIWFYSFLFIPIWKNSFPVPVIRYIWNNISILCHCVFTRCPYVGFKSL